MSKLCTLKCGNPGNPSLILLHGFLGCKEDWEEMIAVFQDSYHCIAIDLPGHGASPYCENSVNLIRAEIQQMTQEKPILIGYSMGGRIAMQLRNCAKALIVISGHPGLETQQEKEERLQCDRIWSEKLINMPLNNFLSEWYAQPIFQSSPRGIIERRMKQNPQDLSKVILQMSLAHQRFIDDFPCPTLFLYGEKDLKYRDLYTKLPKTVSVKRIDGSGHAIPIDKGMLSATEICNWLGNIHANT